MRRTASWVRPANALMSSALKREIRDPDKRFAAMVRRAEEATGGSAEADPAFDTDFRAMVHRFAQVEDLSYLGWTGTIGEMQARMENRLRVRRLIAETPAIADEGIDRPIVVIGLPRTATTLAHKVLAQPEGNRAPLMWELQSTDRSDVDEEVRTRRRKAAERMAGLAKYASPIWPSIHTTAAEAPEECVLALPHGLQWLTRFRLQGYREWLGDHDFAPDYAYLKQVLQVLQYGSETKRWVLKSPFHLYNLPTLWKVFPDAVFLWTHRDPKTVMGSWCSLVETGTALCNRTYDPHRIGADWLDALSWMVERGRDARSSADPGRIVDVSYHRLTADPYQMVPEIFEKLGLDWTAREEGNLEAVLARPGMRRDHEYALSHYGLDSFEVDEAFGDYGRLVAAMN